MKKILQKILIIFILLISLLLRFHNYTLYPQRGATADEYTYPFLGVSLLTKHIPISWSTFPVYKHVQYLTVNHISFPLVYPYFDHPPFYGLIIGSWVLAFGQNTFPKIDLTTIRVMPIFLAIISSFLLYMVASTLYGYKTAIWSLLIFISSVSFVMNMRVSVAENFLTTIFLLSIYLFILFKEQMTYKKIILLGILCGIAFLTKVLGSTVFIAIVSLCILNKIKLKYILTLSSIFIVSVFCFIGYGIFYDAGLFFQIQSLQSARPIGPQTFFYIIITPLIVNKVVYDAWYVFGFFALFAIFLDYKKNTFLIIPCLTYLFLLVFSLTAQGQSGWYIIPLFPFLAMASAKLLVESVREQKWFLFIFVLWIGMGELQMLYEPIFGLIPVIFRTFLIIFFVPLFLAFLFKKQTIISYIGNFLFYVFIIGNIFLTYNYVHPA